MDSPHLLSLAGGALCDNAEWSEHRGGCRPVASHQMVEIKHRAGSTHICPAGALSWGHGEFINEILDTAPEADIVAYRLVNITKLNAALTGRVG